jgi:hypothetical protein
MQGNDEGTDKRRKNENTYFDVHTWIKRNVRFLIEQKERAMKTIVNGTNSYRFSHGHKPRGYGLWWFKVGDIYFSFMGFYSDAKKAAIKKAKEINAVYVEILS